MKPTEINLSVKRVVKRLKKTVTIYHGMDCDFWACDGTPENNRIRNMVTCARCQTIIETNREIKKLEKLILSN
jgi:hypothetical protein